MVATWSARSPHALPEGEKALRPSVAQADAQCYAQKDGNSPRHVPSHVRSRRAVGPSEMMVRNVVPAAPGQTAVTREA
jgi:hypothetical protein